MPTIVPYRSFDGVDYQREAWLGEHIALLIPPEADVDEATMAQLLAALDAGYEYYAHITGREPVPYRTVEGRTSIAVVDATCGAGCGYLGFTGIEFLPDFFGSNLEGGLPWVEGVYDAMADRGEVTAILFYEMGRNFWFFGDQLGDWGFTTGYAVVNRYYAMQATGLPIAYADADYHNVQLPTIAEAYFSSGSATGLNTLGANTGIVNSTGYNGSADLAAALFRTLAEHGGQDDYAQFWQTVGTLPAVSGAQAAFDNFSAAAHAATGLDFSFLFKEGWTFQVGSDQGDTIVAIAHAGSRHALLGFSGDDTLEGSSGAESLFGDTGDDILRGAGGADQLAGGSGDDQLDGGTGSDVLHGGDGVDTLVGGGGLDTLTGGAGGDEFRGTSAELSGDTIVDFGAGDRIIITNASLGSFNYSLSGSTLTYSGGSLTFGSALTDTLVASAATGGGVQLTLGAETPPPTVVRAKMILTEAGQDIIIGGNVEIFGTAAGGEVIEVLRGDILLDASFNLGGDTVVLPGAAGSYTAILSGSFVTISGGDISVAIPVGAAGLAVQFSNSTRTLRFDSGAGEVMLGTQSIGTTAEAVAASGPPLVDAAETGPDSLAKLILTAPGQDVDIGGNVAIFGTASGGEVINVLEGTIQLDASFNLGGDTVVLPGNANTYTATLSGSFVTIASGDISVAIPVGLAGLTVDFGDVDQVLRYDPESGQVLLGTQAIGSTAEPVEPAPPSSAAPLATAPDCGCSQNQSAAEMQAVWLDELPKSPRFAPELDSFNFG